MSPMNVSTQDTPKIAGNNRMMSRIDAKGHSPESQKTALTARDNSDEKHPPARLKSSILRRSALSGLELTAGKPSAGKVQKYERKDRIARDELWRCPD